MLSDLQRHGWAGTVMQPVRTRISPPRTVRRRILADRSVAVAVAMSAQSGGTGFRLSADGGGYTTSGRYTYPRVIVIVTQRTFFRRSSDLLGLIIKAKRPR
jgi:hypothetical protein